MFKEFLQKILIKILDYVDPEPKKEEEEEYRKEEIPRKHKIAVRKIIQPHVEKRIDMGAIADPFGSCLSIVDNLTVSIEIILSRFDISDDQKRKIDQIQKNLNLSKRKFIIMISDKYAERTYGKDLDEKEELETIYSVFENLVVTDWQEKGKRDIYLEEWALNIKQEINKSFQELVQIANEEELPVTPILYNSMSPDVKIKKTHMPKNHPPDDDDDYDDDDDFDLTHHPED